MKEFKETSKELKLTCGESGKGECGVQITIKFPKYINYENEISILKDTFIQVNRNLNYNIWNHITETRKAYEIYTSKEEQSTGVQVTISMIFVLLLH